MGARGRTTTVNVVDVCAISVICAVAVLSLALMMSPLFGYRAFLIQSGSMTPTFRVGDLVVDRAILPAEVRPGDVVTFQDPALGNQLVTHRVVAMSRSGNRADFVTQGDANRVTEHWSVPVTNNIGQVVLHDPAMGRVLTFVSTRLARVIEILLGTLWLGYVGLRRFWRQPSRATVGQLQPRVLRGTPLRLH